jgi:hypothetical protein
MGSLPEFSAALRCGLRQAPYSGNAPFTGLTNHFCNFIKEFVGSSCVRMVKYMSLMKDYIHFICPANISVNGLKIPCCSS